MTTPEKKSEKWVKDYTSRFDEPFTPTSRADMERAFLAGYEQGEHDTLQKVFKWLEDDGGLTSQVILEMLQKEFGGKK